ncbi:TonB-dependent receptor domain-containing protein [Sphingomonas hengshuiensis]|uniref:TonB-dependent receptor n=1 Tax=Sphingomonas hengshuiensis TaxID=1609977 RepID=A0A7U4J7M7_9SPHN|nr:TonB-dependent receptor [Sphingomonas hengshuiensis]AJP71731.1 TonB-dependent receptor [Sphingomonas hengshuiensis]
MRFRDYRLLLAAAPLALLATPALAQSEKPDAAKKGDAAPAKQENFSTGVAKARDQLDSATSTSVVDEAKLGRLGMRSVSDLLRVLPGVRSEADAGDGYGSFTIRGLPLSSTGAKFVQFQEDGLPVLEFGDITYTSVDTFLRADMNLAGIQAIRGGSSSTFASNSPGGVINFISKTGVEEGGTIQTTFGIDYKSYRLDFDYGAHLSDTVRMHVGGFYRQGKGPRDTGFDGQRGGQIKFNLTKEFSGGYIRVYGKYLDDRSPAYGVVPLRATGTDAKPEYQAIAGFDPKHDLLYSRNVTQLLSRDRENQLARYDITDGQHPVAKAFGIETQFGLAGWTITDRFRYSGMSGSLVTLDAIPFGRAVDLVPQLGGAGATLSYANGPSAGQSIANPAALNGNGLLAQLTYFNNNIRSLDNMTNDLRATRVWKLGGGELTTTVGFYKSRQEIAIDNLWAAMLSEVRGGGDAALVNITTAGGVPVTSNGYYGYGAAFPGFPRTCCRMSIDTAYDINAPYGSLNYQIGKLAIGGSVRYDHIDASGTLIRDAGQSGFDVNGDGQITGAEQRVSSLALTAPVAIDYGKGYVSYSLSANYRIAEPLSTFVRYSRGGRANADRLVRGGFVNPATGSLFDMSNAVDMVRQLEGGVKFRKAGLSAQITGFWAEANDSNVLLGARFTRLYQAKGVEFEGAFQRGWFSLTTGATYTKAEIKTDSLTPANVGKKPGRQADLIFQAMPQVAFGKVAAGAVFVGTTGSYTDVSNRLRLPGYVTTDLFAEYRLTDRLAVSLNANNVFDKLAIASANDGTIPASGIVQARVLNGRTISGSIRFDF